jgi:hypothetical protein
VLREEAGTVINLATEQPLTLRQARDALPDGTRPDLATVYRWASQGVRGIVLETERVGGKVYTTREALGRFQQQLAGERQPAAPSPPVLTPAVRRRSAEAAHAAMMQRLRIRRAASAPGQSA